jgi:hypothetical protein
VKDYNENQAAMVVVSVWCQAYVRARDEFLHQGLPKKGSGEVGIGLSVR